MNWLHQFIREEEATTAVEYAVMIGLILAVILGTVSTFGGSAGALFGNIDNDMQAHGIN